MNLPAVSADQLRRLPKQKLERLAKLLTPRLPAKYVPHRPWPKQWAALMVPSLEMLYGGAAGGGKTDYLLMAALQFVEVKGYAALLLRRTFSELEKAGGLLERSHEWLAGTDAKWNGAEMRWRFPSGATLEFGHLQHENDKHKYQSAQYAFIAFDELTSFTESQYRYLFSRLRRLEGLPVPLRMRAASNPGGPGHEWVRARFDLPAGTQERPFLPAKLADNPSLDKAAYLASLVHLDPITRKQLEEGDWTARQAGALFRREWFEIIDELPADCGPGVRRWDLAATPETEGKDPDWTAGCRMHRSKEGIYYIPDVRRFRARPGERDRAIANMAMHDGVPIHVVIEEEPGASGKAQTAYLVRMLSGYRVSGQRVTGDKLTRAAPLASQAAAGNVKLLRGQWNGPFLDELEAFDGSETTHDDQVDAASGAFESLTQRPREAVTFRF